MKRNLIIAAAVLVGIVGLSWITLDSTRGHRPHGNKEPIGVLSPPALSSISRVNASHDLPDKVERTRIALDRISGVSVQEVHDLLSGRSPQEIAEIARQLENLPPGNVSSANLALFFKAWAQLDPIASFQTAFKFKSTWAKNAALEAVFDSVDPAGADSLVGTLSRSADGVISRSMKESLLTKGTIKWSRSDPQAAAEFLQGWGGPHSGEGASGMTDRHIWVAVAENWAAIDPTAAQDWLHRQNSTNAAVAAQGFIKGWWRKDPEAAKSFAASNLTNAEGREAAGALANVIALKDPVEAAKWIAQLPTSNQDVKTDAAASVAAAWVARDPKAAGHWIESLPANEVGAAAMITANFWATTDPKVRASG